MKKHSDFRCHFEESNREKLLLFDDLRMSDLLLVSFANDLTTRAVILQAKKATSSRVFSFAPAGDKIY